VSLHVALLRGINVGAAKRVSMSDLRAVVSGLGFENVRTLLNSGNVVFTTARPATDIGGRIEKALEEHTGVWARVTVLRGSELVQIVDSNPLASFTKHASRLMVSVLNSAADRRRLEPLVKRDWGDEAIALGERVAYVWCPNGTIKSVVFHELARIVRDAVTTRNWATMTKLHAMLEP